MENDNSVEINKYIEKICKRYPGVTRPIRKEDYTLTNEENELLEKSGCLNYYPCFDSQGVQEIIGRPFTSCKICYCCAGDNPAMDNKDLCIFVNDELTCSVCFWDETSPVKYYDNKK